MSAGFRSASAPSPVATTSKPFMQRMVDWEAAIAIGAYRPPKADPRLGAPTFLTFFKSWPNL
jgi:hypothetical protein